MNIFILDNDPVKAAQQHNDKHVVKMIVESAQMLSTAHRQLDGKPETVYYVSRRKCRDEHGNVRFRTVHLKKREIMRLPGDEFRIILGHKVFIGNDYYRDTHANHPCSKWARESEENYMWLWRLTVALCDEYFLRYGKHKPVPKQHKVRDGGLLHLLETPPANIPAGSLTPFPQAIPDEYKGDDTVKAYRDYYIGDKAYFMKYTHREAPDWVQRALFRNTLKTPPKQTTLIQQSIN